MGNGTLEARRNKDGDCFGGQDAERRLGRLRRRCRRCSPGLRVRRSIAANASGRRRLSEMQAELTGIDRQTAAAQWCAGADWKVRTRKTEPMGPSSSFGVHRYPRGAHRKWDEIEHRPLPTSHRTGADPAAHQWYFAVRRVDRRNNNQDRAESGETHSTRASSRKGIKVSKAPRDPMPRHQQRSQLHPEWTLHDHTERVSSKSVADYCLRCFLELRLSPFQQRRGEGHFPCAARYGAEFRCYSQRSRDAKEV